MNTPKECTKSEFARLLGVDPANVSRWASAERLELNARGRVIVLPSLTRLLATLDPHRGGRAGERGDGRTIDTCRRLLEQAGTKAAAANSSEVLELKAQLADVTEQLELERKFRKERCVTDDEQGRMLFQQGKALVREWDELAAARAAGGDAFERLWNRLIGRIFYGWDEKQQDEFEQQMIEDSL